MQLLKKILRPSFAKGESGATAVEYAVMLALILLALLASIVTVGQGSGGLWSDNSQQIDSAMGS